MRLDDTSILITGGGRGLGRALGETLAERGARVVLVARTATELDAAVAAIRARGGKAWGIRADIADRNAVHAIAAQAAELAGPVDILIHNASSLGPVPLAPLLDTDCEALEETLAVGVVGPFRLTKTVLGSMIVRGRGLVLGLSSDAAVNAYPNWGAYSTAKAAWDHLSRIGAEETRGTGVRFVTIDPGEMDTRMHADAIPDADRAALARPEQVAAKLVRWLEHGDGTPSGSRLVLADWQEVADEARRRA